MPKSNDHITPLEEQKIGEAKKIVVYGAGYYAEKVTDILEVYNKQDYTVVILMRIPTNVLLKKYING